MDLQRAPRFPNPLQLINAVFSVKGILLSRLFRRSFPLGSPVMLMVEPGTACQLKCPHCPTGRDELSRPAGRLTIENFRRIWDSIRPAPIRLQLWNQGEPLTNPDTHLMIRHAARSGSWTVMATNAELLASEKTAEEIVTSGLHELVLSLDGASDESHVTYRIGGDFGKVRKGVANVVEVKRRFGLKKPVVTWQYILFRHNLDEMETARQLVTKWGIDRIVFKTAQLEELSREEGIRWLPENPSLRRYDLRGDRWILRRRKHFFCDRLFASAVILWDGTVVPCCFDKDGEYQLGNALEEPFPDIWRGKRFQDFRQRWIDGNRPAMCENCTEGIYGLYGKVR